MSFAVSAEAYDRFMGRFSVPLAQSFANFAGVTAGKRALDVGSGPGALTAELIDRLGVASVMSIDPSESFTAALRARFPELDVRRGAAERLPYADTTFDVVLAQLVVHFMADPVVGLQEMARVTRPGGRIAACVWDHAGDGGPLSLFWRAVHDLDPENGGEADLPGTRDGHLAELFRLAGLRDVESAALRVTNGFVSFEDWWDPYTLGVGPAGSYVASLDPGPLEALKARCRDRLPTAPFESTAVAWAARAQV